ncbi:MAG: hypothetical protein QOI38_2624 [Sphingomonadales bacterium]|jgi:hypothetical protein|nr:hypothetical protein [Sphingomonadales bacterium]
MEFSLDLSRAFKVPLPVLSGSVGHGASIRTDKLSLGGTYQLPAHLYVLYISMAPEGKLIVRHVQDDITPSDIDAAEDRLIAAAMQATAPAGTLDSIKFTEPSYFTIVLDVADWDFYYPAPSNPTPDAGLMHDPIAFLEKKTILIELPVGSDNWVKIERAFSKNYTFFNAQPLEKQVGATRRKAVRCINFLTKNDNGDPLDMCATQDFGFNILVQVPLVQGGVDKVTLLIDPSSQNQGPPPPPTPAPPFVPPSPVVA